MKLRFATLWFAMLFGGTVLAQSEPPDEASDPAPGSGQFSRMQQALDLSDEQIEQIRQLRESGGSREEFRAILTPEQLAKLDDYRARRQADRVQRNRHKVKMPGATGNQPPPDDG